MIAGVAVAIGLAWQAAASPEVAQHARAGMDAEKQGNYSQAAREFKRVTELAPNLAAGFVNLGNAYMQEHNYADAIVPLKRAVELAPDLAGAQEMLGYALLAEGYATESIPHFERAQSRAGLGIAQLQVGRLPDAIANLNAALAQSPNNPDLLYYLGRASGLLSKTTFDTLEARYGDSARAHQALGENYAVLHRIPEAEKEYQEALRIRPDLPEVHLRLGEVYAQASEWAQAEEQFKAEAHLRPGSAEAAYRLGNALLEEGKIKEARVELERANQLRPGMPETLYTLGKAASLSGDVGTAESAWRELLGTEDKGALAAQAHFGLAGLYRKQGRTEDADREMREFQKLQSNGGTEPQ